jgi:transcription antitermination factor NusG
MKISTGPLPPQGGQRQGEQMKTHPQPPPARRRRPKRGRKRGGPRPRVKIPFWVVIGVKGQGLKTFLPMMRKPGKKWQTEAMFPSYLFVLIDGPWHFLKGTFGVTNLMATGDKLSRIRTSIIDRMMAQQDEDGIMMLPHSRKLIKGEQVVIESGSFQTQLVVYDGDSIADRVRVLLNFMGQTVPLEIERHKVRPVND